MMSYKRITLGLLVSIALLALGATFTNSIELGICFSSDSVTDAQCINSFERIGDPLFYGGLALSVVSILLLLAPVGFSLWKKFAVWFVPLAALLFIFYPEPGAWDFLSPMPEQLFQWVSVLYVVVSVLIIGYAYFAKSK